MLFRSRPQLKECVICGEKVSSNSTYILNVTEGGLQCSECIERMLALQELNSNYEYVNINRNKNIKKNYISHNNIVLLNKILASKMNDSDIISEIDNKLRIMIKNYLFFHIGKSDFTTLNLLKKGI